MTGSDDKQDHHPAQMPEPPPMMNDPRIEGYVKKSADDENIETR